MDFKKRNRATLKINKIFQTAFSLCKRKNKKSPHFSFLYSVGLNAFLIITSFLISIFISSGSDLYSYSFPYITKNILIFTFTTLGTLFIIEEYEKENFLFVNSWKFFFLKSLIANIFFYPMLWLLSQSESFPSSFILFNLIVLFLMLSIPNIIKFALHNSFSFCTVVVGTEETIKNFLLKSKFHIPPILVSYKREEVGLTVGSYAINFHTDELEEKLKNLEKNYYSYHIVLTYAALQNLLKGKEFFAKNKNAPVLLDISKDINHLGG